MQLLRPSSPLWSDRVLKKGKEKERSASVSLLCACVSPTGSLTTPHPPLVYSWIEVLSFSLDVQGQWDVSEVTFPWMRRCLHNERKLSCGGFSEEPVGFQNHILSTLIVSTVLAVMNREEDCWCSGSRVYQSLHFSSN